MDVREALLQAAVKVFAEAGTRGATTRRIAEAAGVNEVTLFRQFGSKAALIHEAMSWSANRAFVTTLPADPIDPELELIEWCRAHHKHLHRTRAIIRTSMGEFEQSPAMSSSACKVPVRVAHELHTYLERLRALRLASGDWDAHAAAAMLMGALFADAMGRDMMPERYPYPMREAAAKYVKLLLHAIGVGAQDRRGATAGRSGTSE